MMQRTTHRTTSSVREQTIVLQFDVFGSPFVFVLIVERNGDLHGKIKAPGASISLGFWWHCLVPAAERADINYKRISPFKHYKKKEHAAIFFIVAVNIEE